MDQGGEKHGVRQREPRSQQPSPGRTVLAAAAAAAAASGARPSPAADATPAQQQQLQRAGWQAATATATVQQPPPPSLSLHLARSALWGDLLFCAITVVLLTGLLLSPAVTPAELRSLRTDLALALAGVGLAALAPRTFTRPRVRLPFLALLRLRLVAMEPLSLNLVHILSVRHPSGADGSLGAPRSAAALLRAALLLFVPVGWLQGCIASALGVPLPPALHLLVQAAAVAGPMWRAPTACRAFVDENPANGIVVGALHLVLRQVASLLLLGTREHLAASAAAASRSELCVDVVAALELSLGFVLPTLLVWRAQLRAARHHAASHPGERVQRELAASAYERLCAPVLEAVDDVGGPAVPAALAAVLGFVASTLARDGGA